jgi:hypothetical protein
MLCVSEHKMDRLKKKFVQEGRWPPGSAIAGHELLGVPRKAMRAGHCGCWPDGSSDAKKNELKPCRKVGWVIAPQASAAFVAALEKVLDIYSRPYDAVHPGRRFPGVVTGLGSALQCDPPQDIESVPERHTEGAD